MDMGVIQDTKVKCGVYTRGSAGYIIFVTDTSSRHRGGVVVFYCGSKWRHSSSSGPTLSDFRWCCGVLWCYIVGCCLTTDDASVIERIVASTGQHPRRTKLLEAGDFNTYLPGPEGYYR